MTSYKGPSEAELQRRKLIEIDPDELEERIERLNQITMESIRKTSYTLTDKVPSVIHKILIIFIGATPKTSPL